jgi:hypothetical protein
VCLLTLCGRRGDLSDLSGKWTYGVWYITLANGVRFPDMFESVGIANSSGIVTALIIGVSFLPTALLHWQGQRWHVDRAVGK